MKKIISFTILLLAGILFASFAAVSEAVVTKNGAPIYKSESPGSGEKALATVDKDERVKVLQQKSDMVLVRTSNGVEGWVAKASLKPVSKSGKDDFKMDEAKVQGYLENPQAVYILDMTDPNFKPIKLDRSFGDNIDENIDKETNQRVNDATLKPEK